MPTINDILNARTLHTRPSHRATTAWVRRSTQAIGATAAIAVLGSSLIGAPAHAVEPEQNEHATLITETGQQPDAESDLNGTAQVLSADGRFVVFSTVAALTPSDTNGLSDVYLRDTVDGISILVSGKKGKPGNGDSFEPSVSNDGRYVAFTSTSTNLAKDTSGKDVLDVFVKDMYQGKIRLVSATSNNIQKRQNSFTAVISGNGRFVSFQTFARLASTDTDKIEDVYVRDVAKQTTKQVSLLPGKNTDVRESVLIGDISDNGNLVTFGNDSDLWVRDVRKAKTTRFHHEPDSPPCQFFPAGSAGRPAISGNGEYVAFASCATHLPGEDHTSSDVYVMALKSGRVDRVTKGDGNSYLPSLSRDGRYVGFGSEASNLVAGDLGFPDAFVADRQSHTIVRASQRRDGTGGNNNSATSAVSISNSGHELAYMTYATNLIAGDAYNWREALIWRD